MNQREFERAVEEAKVKAMEKLQEGTLEWLGNRVNRGEEILNGENESEANQEEITEVPSEGGGQLL